MSFGYEYIDDNPPKYTYDETNVYDKKGKVVYSAPEGYGVVTVYDDSYIKIHNEDWDYGLVDLNGKDKLPKDIKVVSLVKY